MNRFQSKRERWTLALRALAARARAARERGRLVFAAPRAPRPLPVHVREVRRDQLSNTLTDTMAGADPAVVEKLLAVRASLARQGVTMTDDALRAAIEAKMRQLAREAK